MTKAVRGLAESCEFLEENGEVFLKGVPEDDVLNDIIAMGKEVSQTNDAMAVRNCFEEIRGMMAQSVEGFADDFEFALDDELKASVVFEVGERFIDCKVL